MFYIELENLMIDTNAYIQGSGCIGSELRKHHPRIFIDSNINQPFYDNCYRKIFDKFGYHKIAFVSTVKLADLNIGDFYTVDKIDWVREHFGFRHHVFFVTATSEGFVSDNTDTEYLIHSNPLKCENWIISGSNRDSHVYTNVTEFNKWFDSTFN